MPELLCPLLVGRDQEWQELQSAFDRLSAGRGSTLVVAGEAGVGKSRLLRESAEEAGHRGAVVLTGRAVEQRTPIAFRPIAEALFSHLRRAGPPQTPELIPFRRILSRLVPEWGLHGEAPGDESLIVLGEAVLRVLAAIGKTSGCVLVLEDLHWSDAETIEVVEYLADNTAGEPVLLLVSLRTEEPSAAQSRLRGLSARRTASIIDLRRLTDQEVAVVAAGCLHQATVAPELAGVLAARAEGLPFLVEELLAAMVQSGELAATTEGWKLDRDAPATVPATFAETVRRRLEGVPGARELLAGAALLGRSFDWRLLAEMSGSTEDQVAEVLRGAVTALLLSVESTDAGPRFRFRHALTRETVLGELLPTERSVLAGRALRAMQTAHPGLPGEWCELAAELAEGAGEQSRSAALYLESARRAFGRGALASSERSLERARRLVGDDEELALEIDEALCEVLVAAGNAERVDEVGQRLVSELTAARATGARRARAHLWLARTATDSADWETARHQLERARELAGNKRAATGELETLAARVALGEGRVDDAASFARAALAVAQSGRRYALACEALEILGQMERQRDLAEAERAFAQALALAEGHGLTLWRIRALHELGTIDLLGGGPIDRLAQARQAALDAGALATAATVSLQMAAWSANHHEPEQAVEAGLSCATEAGRLRLPLVAGLGLVLQAVGLALADRRAEMEAALDRARTVSSDHPEVRGVAAVQARTLLWLVREDRNRALAELDAGMDLLRGTPVTAPCRGLWALVHALDRSDGEAATLEVEASGLTVYWLIRGWAGHARAVLLGRQGRIGEAEETFDRADADLAPCDWYRQHARRLVAEAAIADGWGDPSQWLTEALAYFDAIGPPAVTSACRSLLRRTGAPVPRHRRPARDLPPALATHGVTPREAEVLALLAEGRSTKEIAARLYLSSKTVERHITNLSAKVGVESRSELVAFAARHRLEPE